MYSFENYAVLIGKIKDRNVFYAGIEEFWLFAEGRTEEEAISALREQFAKHIQDRLNRGKQLPIPGSGKAILRFAPNSQMERLRPFVDDFWERVLGTSYGTSFVSDESNLEVWIDMYVSGGLQELLARVQAVYGVDISEFWDEPIPVVL